MIRRALPFLLIVPAFGFECEYFDVSPEQGQLVFVDLATRAASQSGGVGSTVSNGLFVAGDVADLSAYGGHCYPGFDLESVTYEWSMTGRDFAGNVESLDGNSIRYDHGT